MARVPLQTSPQQELAVGSEVQFGATSVEPVRDVVSDDLSRRGQALQRVGQMVNKLDDELTDAESKQLANEYSVEAQTIRDRYVQLQGVNAVGTTKTADGKDVRIFDTYESEMEALLQSYQNRASNDRVKYIFENKAQVYTRSLLNDMTRHSLKQNRLYNEKETEVAYKNSILRAKNSYKDFADPGGEFNKYYLETINQATEYAQLKGWETNPEKGLSKQFINLIQEVKMEIAKDVVLKLSEDDNPVLRDAFLKQLDPEKEDKTVSIFQKIATEIEENKRSDDKVQLVLNNNVDQNNGEFLSNMKTLLSLSSNQTSNDGKDAHVKNGLHSDEIENFQITQSESIEVMNNKLKLSKFYDPNTTKTLLPQHKILHMFAIQRVGVQKADSLYTRAEREYKASIPVPTIKRGNRVTTGSKNRIDKYRDEFFNNPDNFKIVNKGIADRYNTLVLAEFRRKNLSFYTKTKKIFREDTVKRSDFGDDNQGQRKFSRARAQAKRNPENYDEVDVNVPITMGTLGAYVGTPEYAGLQKQMIYNDKVANDQQVLVNNINYDFDPTEETIIVDKKTGLQPIKNYEKKIKDTTKDPIQQKYEIKNLGIEYKKIKEEREAAYNSMFIPATQIAFAEDGGWKLLPENNINIYDFTEEDQKILKEGAPEESDTNTLVDLINNPLEARDNIDFHIHKLNRTEYAELKRYSESLKNQNNYVEAVGNKDMLKATLDRYDMGDLHRNKGKKNNIKYLAIHDAWLKEINARQIANGNKKLTMGEKQKALNYVLLTDLVNVDKGGFLGRDATDVIPATVEFDNLQSVFVNVLFEGQNVKVFTSKINDKVLKLIQDSIRGKKKYPTQALIAEYWLKSGKAETETEARRNLENYGLTD